MYQSQMAINLEILLTKRLLLSFLKEMTLEQTPTTSQTNEQHIHEADTHSYISEYHRASYLQPSEHGKVPKRREPFSIKLKQGNVHDELSSISHIQLKM